MSTRRRPLVANLGVGLAVVRGHGVRSSSVLLPHIPASPLRAAPPPPQQQQQRANELVYNCITTTTNAAASYSVRPPISHTADVTATRVEFLFTCLTNYYFYYYIYTYEQVQQITRAELVNRNNHLGACWLLEL